VAIWSVVYLSAGGYRLPRARNSGRLPSLTSHRSLVTSLPVVDITIIGGGPTGLFGLFYAGMRGVSAQIVDALPALGGQLTALYPEKYIFDVGGLPKVLAKDLVRALAEQASQFHMPVHLNQRIVSLEEEEGHLALVSETSRIATRAIVIAAGIGAFSPRRLPQACAAPWYGRGISDLLLDPEEYRGRRVVIIGGGDSAFDWAHQLQGRAASVTLMHRSDRFRAHAATVAEVQNAVALGKTALLTFHELHDVIGDGEKLSGIVARDIKTKLTREIPCDAVLPMLGYVSDLGDITNWGLTLEKEEIVVNSRMETGRPGLYAAGDVTTYPGKLKLIALGFAEAATAVNEAVHWLHPEKKVAPGHSSNMAIFGQKDD
jgi:thioredoxin reductase (NADPH)